MYWYHDNWEIFWIKASISNAEKTGCRVGHRQFIRRCDACGDWREQLITHKTRLEAALYRQALEQIKATTGCDTAYKLSEEALALYEVPAGTTEKYWY